MRIRTALILGPLLALGVAGCGTTGGDGVATAGGAGGNSTSAKPGDMSERDRALKFSQCVRDNGVPNFPDPKFSDGGGVDLSLPDGVDPQKVAAAQEKCKQYAPNSGEQTQVDPQLMERLRKYSACMRENGVPKFPDPTDQGLQVDNDKLGIDPNDPRFKAAEQACAKHLPDGGEGGTTHEEQNPPGGGK